MPRPVMRAHGTAGFTNRGETGTPRPCAGTTERDALRDFDTFLKAQRRRLTGKLEGSVRRIRNARGSREIPESWSGDSWDLVEHRKG